MSKVPFKLIDNAADLREYVSRINYALPMAQDTESTGLSVNAILLGKSFYQKGSESVFVQMQTPFWEEGVSHKEAHEILNPVYERIGAIFHNGKYDLGVYEQNGFTLPTVVFDTLVGVHIWDASLKKQLEVRVKEDYSYDKQTFKQVVGKNWDKIDWYVDTKKEFDGKSFVRCLAEYAAEDTYWTWRLYEDYAQRVNDMGCNKIMQRIELPLLHVLKDMTRDGVLIDADLLYDMKHECDAGIVDLTESIYKEAGCIFNINSGQQKAKVLYDKMGLPCYGTTKSGARSTDGDCMDKLAAEGYNIAEMLSEYATLSKLNTGYIIAIPKLLDTDGRLRAGFNASGTETGRFCIEGNQLITTVGGSKPIKDVVVGDLVYCYDNRGKLRIRKVLNVWNKGRHDVVRLNWQSSGNNQFGSLICTPNHRIKTKTRGWIEAQHLVTDEKVYHLHRDSNHNENGNVRPRLYGTHSFMEVEQQTIKREYFGASSKLHIHHIDEDTSNNTVSNLKVMTHSSHTSMHTKKRADLGLIKFDHLKDKRARPRRLKNHYGWKDLSRFSLLRMLMKSGGRPSKVDMDFDTYKRKCKMSGLPLSELCKRFDSKGSYINRGRVVATDTMTTREAYLHLNVGYYRLLELKEFYGVTNHKVVSVETCGKSFVYDIEVEDFNNFIASEICVHNSSSKPNLQNQPNSDLFPVRKAFIAAEGYKLVVLDWSQIELRVTAHFSKDERLMQAFLDGRDIHQEVADAIHIKRKEAKSVNFGILYGLSAASLALYIKNTEKVATKMLSDYGDTYNGVMAWKRHVEQQCADNGYVKNMFGRVRRLPHVKERKFYFRALRQAVNFVIQGTCADMMKLAMIRVHEFFKAENIDARILLTVHDELVIECRANITQYVFTRVKEIMEQLIPMRVPIIADGKICDNWSQMKDDKYEGYMSSQKYLNLLTTTF